MLEDGYWRLRQVLRDGRWHKQKEIQIRDPVLKGHKVRAVCQEYPAEFIGNVKKGYRLVSCATEDEIEWAINSLRSRARKIRDRADILERVATGPRQGGLF